MKYKNPIIIIAAALIFFMPLLSQSTQIQSNTPQDSTQTHSNTTQSIETMQRMQEITKSLKCLTCAGQSVYDSESQFSSMVRRKTLREINEGKSNQEVIDLFYQEYGEQILVNPKKSSHLRIIYIIPIFITIIAALCTTIKLMQKS